MFETSNNICTEIRHFFENYLNCNTMRGVISISLYGVYLRIGYRVYYSTDQGSPTTPQMDVRILIDHKVEI